MQPTVPKIKARIEPAFPLPEPNTAPDVIKKCIALTITASKPNNNAVLVPFAEERFFDSKAMTKLDTPKNNSTNPIARAVVIPLTYPS